MNEHSLSTVNPADMGAYRATARRQNAREQQALEHRQKRAWDLARCAATLLKEHFGASRVVVFGSLIHAGCFTRWSDVDIAAWGIAPHDTFRAIGAVHDLATDIADEPGGCWSLPANDLRGHRARRGRAVIARYLVVAGRIRQELATLERVVTRVERAAHTLERTH